MGRRLAKNIENVKILGDECHGKIIGLDGPRSMCSLEGIEKADAVLGPLEH